MQTPTPTALMISNHNVEIQLHHIGPSDGPSIVLLHGLRDTSWSLLGLAQTLAERGFFVVFPDLRGHGQSQHSDGYALPNFLSDLHAVQQWLHQHNATQTFSLFGHSLGGHIVCKFAALFPEVVNALMIVEGLGPPTRASKDDDAADIVHYRQMLEARQFAKNRTSKPMPDLAYASNRLRQGNPRLSEESAKFLATKLTQPDPAGLRWNFDSKAQTVFIGAHQDTDAKFWRQVQAPTLVISGALSHQYWGQMMPDGSSGHFAEGEIESRVAQFCNAQHRWFEHSGHMVHYDEPERLNSAALEFFSQHNPMSA